MKFIKQLEVDKEKYPGGCMVGFIIFISEKKSKFMESGGDVRNGIIFDMNGFDNFLKEKTTKKESI